MLLKIINIKDIKMTTEISVDKKTIEEFLKDAQKEPFLIPEYQRQYSWEKSM